MKNILSIGCALLILSACQKNMTNTPNTVKDVTKIKRSTNAVYGLWQQSGNYNQLIEIWSVPPGSLFGMPNSFFGNALGIIEFSPNNPVPNMTGLAYDFAGFCYVLYRTGPNVDWEVARFPANNPGAAVPFATLDNTDLITDLRDLEFNNVTGEFFILDRSNAANGDYKVHKFMPTGGSTNVTFGPILVSNKVFNNVQGINVELNGNVTLLDKENGNNDNFYVREIDPVILQEVNAQQLTATNSAGTNNFSLANIAHHEYILNTEIYVGNCFNNIMNQANTINTEFTIDPELNDLASK
jgi:hypothetical protein